MKQSQKYAISNSEPETANDSRHQRCTQVDQISGISMGEKSNKRIVFSLINMPYMLIKKH